MTNEILNISRLARAASDLAAELAADIPLCKTREEHIRVTARANAAATLAAELNIFMEAASE